MAAIQEISGRIGRTTGHGIAGNVCRNYSTPVIWSLVALLFIANTINVAADLGARRRPKIVDRRSGPALRGGIRHLVGAGAGLFSVRAVRLHSEVANSRALRLCYCSIHREGAVGRGFGRPFHSSGAMERRLPDHAGGDPGYGPSRPICSFWQSSQEAEEQDIDPDKKPLKKEPENDQKEISRIRVDTLVGMAMSNIIAIAIIIITTAATLHAKGVTDIQSSSQAAEALKPIAGAFAELIFTLGIIGTGLLAIPVLAGSTAYAIGEGRRWPVCLSRKPKEAVAFYTVLALSVALGIRVEFHRD
jgi:natural resistance-associated macrophage protein